MAVDKDTFKKALGAFCSGVTIVTFNSRGAIHGLTVSAFSSLSLDPPLILVCIKKDGLSHSLLVETRHLAVNILSRDQVELCTRFANPDLSSEERFEAVPFRLSQNGAPIFDGVVASLDCRITDNLDGGDHTIFVGEVQETEVDEEREPLVYYKGVFRKIV
jgi:flavin reductase (DIM6/NTAB) family NADH-FMN oxidoreductase RutF